MCPTICFCIYRLLSLFTVHGRHPYKLKITCALCSTVPKTDANVIFYSQKVLVLMETSITDFYDKLNIPKKKNHLICHLHASSLRITVTKKDTSFQMKRIISRCYVYLWLCRLSDWFQPKMSTFPTRAPIIWHPKTDTKILQPNLNCF